MEYTDELKKILPEELLRNSCTSPPEIKSLAWYKHDVKKVLTFLRDKQRIVLGGEVLVTKGNKLEETWDYWNYDIDDKISQKENVEKSYNKAIDSVEILSNIVGDDVLYSIHIWSDELQKYIQKHFYPKA
jgi:hypothetical protein